LSCLCLYLCCIFFSLNLFKLFFILLFLLFAKVAVCEYTTIFPLTIFAAVKAIAAKHCSSCRRLSIRLAACATGFWFYCFSGHTTASAFPVKTNHAPFILSCKNPGSGLPGTHFPFRLH